MENQTHTHKNENPDSIEIGTPSKGGAIKIYFDVSDPEHAESKFIDAMKLLAFARKEHAKLEGVKP